MANNKPPLSISKKITFTLIIFFIFSFLIVLIGEIIIRNFYKKEYGPPPRAMTDFFYSEKDELLGWKIKPNFSLDTKTIDKAGVEYELKLNYNENSFKVFGNINSEKPKVFFIGDSYTASVEVSNKKSFFNLIKDSLDVEVFALAAGGYGTMQEYLAMEKWVDEINPDLLVLEVCNNDFIDNTPEMERLAAYKVSERRPYLNEEGNIFYERPISQWELWQKNILFFKWLDIKWKALIGKIKGGEWKPAEWYVSNIKMEYPPLKRSAEITDLIVGKMQNSLPEKTKMLAFNADAYDPQVSIFRNIFNKYGVHLAEQPAVKVVYSDLDGNNPYAADGYHWNELGHELIAKELVVEIRKILFENSISDSSGN